MYIGVGMDQSHMQKEDVMDDMNFMFTDEQNQLRKKVRKFGEEKLAPLAPELEESGEISWDLVKLLAKEGYLRLMAPKEYGGTGVVSCVNICIIREEWSRTCAPAAGIFTMQGLGTYPITQFGTDEQKRKYLPQIASGKRLAALAMSEPDAGSDVASMKTTAVRDGDSYILNGMKRWISGGPAAEIYSVFAKTDPTKGSKGISAFIVEKGTPGFDPSKRMRLMAAHTICEPKFENCRVPKENLLGKENEGMRIALLNLDMFRTTVGATAVGHAQRAYEEAISRAKSRVVFGRPLAEYQLTQAKLADMATEIQAARLLVYWAAILKDQGADWRKVMTSASMAKLYASEVCHRVVDESIQIHGGSGLIKGVPIEHLYRAVRSIRLYEGTSEIQRITIARGILREDS
jgi:alkylation response protein AidB-like acyl-CoA dehydrogenase